jgi:hypothetical protein
MVVRVMKNVIKLLIDVLDFFYKNMMFFYKKSGCEVVCFKLHSSFNNFGCQAHFAKNMRALL